MITPTCDLHDLLLPQFRDHLRHHLPLTKRPQPELSRVVLPPRVHLPRLHLDGARVIVPARDLRALDPLNLAGHADRSLRGCLLIRGREAQLPRVVAPAGVEVSVGGREERVVLPAGEGEDTLAREGVEEGRVGAIVKAGKSQLAVIVAPARVGLKIF